MREGVRTPRTYKQVNNYFSGTYLVLSIVLTSRHIKGFFPGLDRFPICDVPLILIVTHTLTDDSVLYYHDKRLNHRQRCAVPPRTTTYNRVHRSLRPTLEFPSVLQRNNQIGSSCRTSTTLCFGTVHTVMYESVWSYIHT